MARVHKSVEYKTVKRFINGHEFESIRSTTHKKTKKSTGRRHYAKFGIAAHLASFITKLDILYECWKVAELEGSRGYNRIISYNSGKMTPEGPTDSVIITPPGFEPPFKEFTCADGTINIMFDDKFRINPDSDYMAIIMIAFNPKVKRKIPFEILRIHYNRIIFSNNFSIDLNLFKNISLYNKFIIYSAVMRKTPEKLSWSSTYTISVDNENSQ